MVEYIMREYHACESKGESAMCARNMIRPEEQRKAWLVDELTGLYNRQSFCMAVNLRIEADRQGAAEGRYAMVCFDVLRFKAINELFGPRKGDRLLLLIAGAIRDSIGETGISCRMDADHFAVWMHYDRAALEKLMGALDDAIAGCDLPFKTTFNAGVYVTCPEQLNAEAMLDRAKLAQRAIKGKVHERYREYDESLRRQMLSEYETEGTSHEALRQGQFKVFYQPQYSHSTGALMGAEALVRWQHPERGMLLPGMFIPIFEKNGFITALDLYVFECACKMLARCMKEELPLVPVSTNFSRQDVFREGFVEQLERIREACGVPARYLHIELTETVFVGGSSRMNAIIDHLHSKGYTVQMDDFGSGYSSLNILKDMNVDCFKLDMDFLTGGVGNSRGGTILSTVVRMAKWLGVRVIAEGVETCEQADFLRSIGCDCMQGYLYAQPMDEDAYVQRIREGASRTRMHSETREDVLKADFWNPQSMDTLVFSRYAGPAAILEYREGQVEILRVNEKYVLELGMNQTEKELIESDLLTVFDEDNRRIYLEMLDKTAATGEEQECETWRTLTSSCCGKEHCFVRATAQHIGENANAHLFFVTIRNITSERMRYDEILSSERRFKIASEQVNIYYWEYTIATKEMRPCFRCMRDLGLPALMTNYPESAFERGVFPPEIHDLYRSWHRQVAAGVPELEAIMPLTMERIPFRVRYTTEFDEYGRPVKAYGSAALVKDAAATPAELETTDAGSQRALELIAQHSDRVVLLYDMQSGSIRFSDAMDDQYGMDNSTIDELFRRIMPESQEAARRILRNMKNGIPYGRENIRFKYREGFFCWLDFKYTTIFDEEKKPTGAFFSYVDITEKVEAMERSKTDGMTGLLNRATAEKSMSSCVERSQDHPGILLLLDIDGLKGINDTLGHPEGDEAIKRVADTLKRHFRASDIVGRFGGDEFAVYLEDAAENAKAIENSVRALLQKIAAIDVGTDGTVMRVQCSIGCAVQEKGESFDALYRRADTALYNAKRCGKNGYAFYTQQMEKA